MNDEEQRVQAILKFTFRKLDEVLAQPVVKKESYLPANSREQQGKQQPRVYPVRDEKDIS